MTMGGSKGARGSPVEIELLSRQAGDGPNLPAVADAGGEVVDRDADHLALRLTKRVSLATACDRRRLRPPVENRDPQCPDQGPRPPARGGNSATATTASAAAASASPPPPPSRGQAIGDRQRWRREPGAQESGPIDEIWTTEANRPWRAGSSTPDRGPTVCKTRRPVVSWCHRSLPVALFCASSISWSVS